jgi:Zn-dependent M28 family amino/carboxypeptidase
MGCSTSRSEGNCVSSSEQEGTASVVVSRLPFVADSAYAYIDRQVAFGARVPGTESHRRCGDWLVSELSRHGAEVTEQKGEMVNYAGAQQPIRNIVGYVEGTTPGTVLLCAHWDCRPWSDEERAYEHRFDPVMGANDGASGVGVILEIVRQWSLLKQEAQYNDALPGLQIVFFDCEDMGTPTHYTGKEREHTWCLGSQLWAREYQSAMQARRLPHKIRYGILLDMVGDPTARFPRDYCSMQYAGAYVEQLWATARRLGYGTYFVTNNTQNGAYCTIIDDHYYVNTIAGIPCLDIIDYNPHSQTGFKPWWHTRSDDMRNINKQTLKAVGETVITSLCSK